MISQVIDLYEHYSLPGPEHAAARLSSWIPLTSDGAKISRSICDRHLTEPTES